MFLFPSIVRQLFKIIGIAGLFVILLCPSLTTTVMSEPKPRPGKTAEVCKQTRDENNNAIALCCMTTALVNGRPLLIKDLTVYSQCKHCDASGKCTDSITGKPTKNEIQEESDMSKVSKENVLRDLNIAIEGNVTDDGTQTSNQGKAVTGTK